MFLWHRVAKSYHEGSRHIKEHIFKPQASRWFFVLMDCRLEG